MARKTYRGYLITHLRTWAKDLKIAGRSKMDGWGLVAACFAQTRANVLAAEKAVIDVVDVKPGTLLRHKTSGAVLRVTSDLREYVRDGHNYESLCFTAEYVTAGSDGRLGEDATYLNRWADRNAAVGYTIKHMLYQHEAI